ncbi:MAG: DinB family protein [Chloroflexota bacterium]
MIELHPSIRTALVSVNPTTGNPAWHGCPTALGVLRGVGPTVAVWRPYPGANNIREIALHIAFCENSVANKLSGTSARVGFPQRKTGWAVMLDAVDAAQWKAEIGLLRAAHERLTAALIAFDPALLDEPAGRNTTRPAAEFIHGVAEHTLYHAAQMEAIKTLAKHHRVA